MFKILFEYIGLGKRKKFFRANMLAGVTIGLPCQVCYSGALFLETQILAEERAILRTCKIWLCVFAKLILEIFRGPHTLGQQ